MRPTLMCGQYIQWLRKLKFFFPNGFQLQIASWFALESLWPLTVLGLWVEHVQTLCMHASFVSVHICISSLESGGHCFLCHLSLLQSVHILLGVDFSALGGRFWWRDPILDCVFQGLLLFVHCPFIISVLIPVYYKMKFLWLLLSGPLIFRYNSVLGVILLLFL